MTRYRVMNTPRSSGSLITTGSYPTTTEIIVRSPAVTRTMTDEVVKNYRKRSAQGEIFNNRLYSTSTKRMAQDTRRARYYEKPGFNDVRVDAVWTAGSALEQLINTGQVSFPDVVLETSEAAARAAIQAISSVNKTEVDLGNVMVEWSKTQQLHRDLGNAFVKLVKEGAVYVPEKHRFKQVTVRDHNGNPILKKNGKPVVRYLHEKDGGFKRSKSARANRVADLYLIYRMGILPLLSDLEGAVKVLMDMHPERNTARGGEVVQGSASKEILLAAGFGKSHLITASTVKTWSIRYGILYESSFAGRMVGQLGLTRPLSTAWESLPWSFVVDHWVNIGSWLDAIQPSGAHKNLSAWESTEESVVHTLSVGSDLVSSDLWYDWADSFHGGLTHITTSKQRLPWVPAVPSRPALGSGFSKPRVMDYVALVLQRLKFKN